MGEGSYRGPWVPGETRHERISWCSRAQRLPRFRWRDGGSWGPRSDGIQRGQ
ncbi:hypothetical protein CRUP_027521, partial [Coryphaenoides rupestris]